MERFFKAERTRYDSQDRARCGHDHLFLHGVYPDGQCQYVCRSLRQRRQSPGGSYGAIYIATAISAIAGTMGAGLLANLPLAQASGMGLNAFFVYTVCIGFGLISYLVISVFCGDLRKIKGSSWLIGLLFVAMLILTH